VLKKLWIGFVFLLAVSCVAIFLSSFFRDDSPRSEPAQTRQFDPSPALATDSKDFHADAGIPRPATPHAPTSSTPVDAKELKRLESSFGAQDSGPLNVDEPGYVPPVVPTQSVRAGK
jgi:hypothetical protein